MNRSRLPASHLNVSQAALFVGVTRPAVLKRIKHGRLGTIPVFGVLMVSARDLRTWMRERATRRTKQSLPQAR